MFVDADADDRLGRVIQRDMMERGRDVRKVLDRNQDTVKPMHLQFIEPSKRYADIIVPQGGENEVSISILLNTIEKKLRIARKVATLIMDGETILIESGSVNVLLACEILKIRKATIITTNVFIARQFRKDKNADIIILGGIYQNESETLVGKITKACIDQIYFDKAFIGIDGYDKEAGFMLRDLLRAEISSHIIQRAHNVFVVSDSTKFGRRELTNISYLSDIQHVAIDDDLGPEFRREIKNSGVDLILA